MPVIHLADEQTSSSSSRGAIVSGSVADDPRPALPPPMPALDGNAMRIKRCPRLYITKKRHVQRYGPTPLCDGCILNGVSHSTECRERIHSAMRSEPMEAVALDRQTAKEMEHVRKLAEIAKLPQSDSQSPVPSPSADALCLPAQQASRAADVCSASGEGLQVQLPAGKATAARPRV